MRKTIAVLLLVLLALLPVLPACAETTKQTNPETGYTAVIEDGANLLDSAEYAGVLEQMMEITKYCNVGFYTCMDGSSAYSLTKAKNWAQNDQGLYEVPCTVFIIDMTNRHLDIWSSDAGGVYRVITTDVANTVTDNTYRYASREDYAGCAREVFSQIAAVLEGQKIAEPMR